MFKFFSLILIVGLGFNISILFGQKSRSEKTPIKYTQLPKIKVPNDIQTYNTFISLKPNSVNYNNIGGAFANKLYIGGFQKQIEGYDLEINLKLGSFEVLETSPRVNKYEKKKKDGTVKITYSYYYYMRYRMPATLTVRGYDGETYFTKTISGPDIEATTSTKGYNSAAERDTYWRNNKQRFFKEKEAYAIGEYIKSANNHLSRNLGYNRRTSTPKIFYPENSRKTDFDYSSFLEAKEFLKNGFSARIPDDTTSGNEDIRKAIAIWSKEVQTANFEEKRPRINGKMAKEIYINMAFAYIFLYQFDQAEKILKKAEPLKGASQFKSANNLLNDQKIRHNLHPLWNGKRHIEERSRNAVTNFKRPDIYTTQHNDRLRQAKIASQGSNGFSGNSSSTKKSQTTFVDVLEKTSEVLEKAEDLMEKKQKTQAAQPPSHSASAGKFASSSTSSEYISYDLIKANPDPELANMTQTQRFNRLCTDWQISKVVSYNPAGKAQIIDISMMNSCEAKQSYNFALSKVCTLSPSCSIKNPNGEITYKWMMTPDGGAIVLLGDQGATNYTVMQLSETSLVLETQLHRSDKPMTRYFYTKKP